MRKFSVTTAQRVARKKPNFRAKYFMLPSCLADRAGWRSPPRQGRGRITSARSRCVMIEERSSDGLAYGSCSLGQPTALSVR